jgi:hypothetical protein
VLKAFSWSLLVRTWQDRPDFHRSSSVQWIDRGSRI